MSNPYILKISHRSELEKALEIRRIVFVDGQNVPLDREIDGLDDQADHYLIFMDSKPCGTARVRWIDQSSRIERLAVLPCCQGKGLGRALMEYIINDCLERNPFEIYLHAQFHLVDYYAAMGFEKRGYMFMDAGIKHIEMFMK